MKTRLLLAGIWFASIVFVSDARADNQKSVTLSVPKMYCVACELTVKKALKKVAGVENVQPDLRTKTVVVQFDADKAATADLIQASTKAGFPASVKQ